MINLQLQKYMYVYVCNKYVPTKPQSVYMNSEKTTSQIFSIFSFYPVLVGSICDSIFSAKNPNLATKKSCFKFGVFILRVKGFEVCIFGDLYFAFIVYLQ
eukprot:TRINITY_DN1299_c0_g2_i2.p5 TRINITY_DN1299_c0_g2~~TRINITY_DN1299_c0_g2_i2.p5  ORF type:complete len:100 (+),score=0.95 TRINITY_DN1299_c0_g2_i2:630-929(+)